MSLAGSHTRSPTIGSDDGDSELHASILSEINITPLTDIFLVLLIIFMVTSSVMSQLGMDVELPSSSPELSTTKPGGVVLTLLPDGRMSLLDHTIEAGSWTELERELRKAFSRTSGKLLILEGDRKAFLGNAIEVMDRAKRAGAESFAIATKSE